MISVWVCESLVVALDTFDLKWWIEVALIEWFLLCSGCVSFSGKLFSGNFFFFFLILRKKLNFPCKE
jgi:hypothetical protein